ncbi:hypothetical protein SK128_028044 [Halocaridina rubra]|uniref:Uncharacterized protein n=1 Tax=Halocaridina rubra TaxID=373956 RepID=A0AAN8WWD8_HALRR
MGANKYFIQKSKTAFHPRENGNFHKLSDKPKFMFHRESVCLFHKYFLSVILPIPHTHSMSQAYISPLPRILSVVSIHLASFTNKCLMKSTFHVSSTNNFCVISIYITPLPQLTPRIEYFS